MRFSDDQARVLRWNTVLWAFLGLAPEVVAAQDDPPGTRVWSSGVPIALGLAYAAARRFPGRLPWFLWVLAAGIGVVAYFRDGAATLFVASLPMFWLHARSVRDPVWLSTVAVVAALAGDLLRGGDLRANAVVSVVGYGAGTVLALTVRRRLELADRRAERLGAELAGARSELAEAHRREGAAAERERMAREIHDTLAQGFASIVVLAEAARSDVRDAPDDASRQVATIERIARENLAEARVLVGSSPHATIASGSVTATLRRTLDRFAEDTGLAVDAELDEVDGDQTTRVALLRCTQESLANVRKHADASAVGVVLTRFPEHVELEVTDDGRGFAVEDARGFGLAGMRRRLAELGGDLTVTSSVGDGTRILAVLPLPEPLPPPEPPPASEPLPASDSSLEE
ncbi:sensor histidine kinase [Actinomadura logoneensis]|uniref:sensor histidine kinase n=1 Tax=Actinomadura logoneensis TaxID=2293572 RepID=UPI0018F10F43|nr:sensor histidine kinase [Actinomadura logoneensis]